MVVIGDAEVGRKLERDSRSTKQVAAWNPEGVDQSREDIHRWESRGGFSQ